MGLVCSTAQLACLCGSSACSLCCSQCPSCRNSTSSRIMYALMLIVGTIVACIFLSPGLEDILKKVPFCSNTNHSVSNYVLSGYQVNCESAVGYLAVYRICFILSLFFFMMSAMMIRVKSSNDGRAPIQNGFWAIKYFLVIGGVIGAFFIPEGSFSTTLMYFGFIGGFLFILVQLALIVDFAHSWADAWVGNYEDTGLKRWYSALLGATFINYALSLTGIVLLYWHFTKSDDCSFNKFFILFNMVLCVAASAVSILPKVQEHSERSGLLQSSIVTLYVIYLTWSGLSNNPNTSCNTAILGTHDSSGKERIVGLAIWFVCIMYSSITTASKSSKIAMSEKILVKDNGAVRNSGDQSLITNRVEGHNGDAEEGGAKVWDNEEDQVAYNWSFFHLMFALATLYVMMTITNWYQPGGSSLNTLPSNMASMWVKIISSWMCVGLYVWSLIAPAVFPDRNFS